MAQEYNKYNQLTGVMVPAPGWDQVSISDDLTTAKTLTSEVGPGDIVTLESSTPLTPVYNTTISLDASGKMSQQQLLTTVRGGSPGFQTDGMRVVWKDETSVWRGFQDHNIISDIDDVNKIYYGPVPNITGGTYHVRNTTILSDGDGGAVILVGLTEDVRMHHYLPKTFDLTSARTISERGTSTSARGTEDRSGIASTLPVTGYVDASGTVTCFHLVLNQASSEAGVRADTYNLWTTRCDGSFRKDRYPQSCFRQVGNWASPTNIGLTANSVVQSMTCSSDGAGNILLLINYIPDKTLVFPTNNLVQLASNNGGLTFTLIGFSVTTVDGSGYPQGSSYAVGLDTVYYNGSFLILKGRYEYSTLTSTISSYKIPSPFISIVDIEENIIFSDLAGEIDNLCAYTHTDGRAFCLVTTSSETYLLRTEDGGSVWDTYTSGFARGLRSYQISACEINGSAIILSGGLNNVPYTVDNEYLLIIKAGGWESITHPRILNTAPYELHSYGTRKGSSDITSATYIPQTLPASYNGLWTTSTSGTTSETITAGQPWLNLIKSTTSSIVYLATLDNCTYNTGMLVAAILEHTSGGYLYVESNIKAGTTMYSAQIRLTSTALQLVDGNTGTVKGSYAVASGTAVRCKMAFRQGQAQLFVQISEGVWQSVVQASGFSGSIGPIGDGEIRFGLPASSTGAGVGRFYFIGVINTAGGGDQTFVPSGGGAAQPAYNDDLSVFSSINHVPWGLHGAPVPVSGYGKMPLPSGLKISGSGGWSQRGEIHRVGLYSKYSLDKCLSPSPSKFAKVEVDAVASNDIVFEISGISSDRKHLGDAFGISITNTDLDNVSVSTSADGIIWNILGDISLAQEIGLPFVRTGSLAGTIIPGPGALGAHYYELDELIGCKILFSDGTVARVVHNSSGRFSADGKGMQIHIEWSSTTPPQVGTCSIFRREATAIFTNILPADAYYRYVKVTIPAQKTINWTGSGQDWASIGSIVFGTYIPFSNKYSSTRTILSTPNIAESKNRAGLSRIVKLGRSLQTIQVSWAEGFDTSEASSSSPGSFISLPRGYDIPVGHRGAGTILEGIQRAINDGELPLVYIPKIDPTVFINDYGDIYQWTVVGKAFSLLCQMIDVVSRDIVLGEENTSEVVRMSGIALKELA